MLEMIDIRTLALSTAFILVILAIVMVMTKLNARFTVDSNLGYGHKVCLQLDFCCSEPVVSCQA